MSNNSKSEGKNKDHAERNFFLALSFTMSIIGFICAADWLSIKKPTTIPKKIPSQLESWPCYKAVSGLPGCASGSYLRAYDKNSGTICIVFEEIECLDAHWYGKNAVLCLENGEILEGDPARKVKQWGDLVDYTYTTIYPSFEVTLPFTSDDWHKTIKIKASMDIVSAAVKETYEAINGHTYLVRRLMDATESVNREYTFFIVSPDELLWREQHDAWLKRDSLIFGFVFFQLFAVVWLFFAFPRTLPNMINKFIH